MAWQFSGRDPEARKKAALRVIALAAYVGFESVRTVLTGAEAVFSR